MTPCAASGLSRVQMRVTTEIGTGPNSSVLDAKRGSAEQDAVASPRALGRVARLEAGSVDLRDFLDNAEAQAQAQCCLARGLRQLAVTRGPAVADLDAS